MYMLNEVELDGKIFHPRSSYRLRAAKSVHHIIREPNIFLFGSTLLSQ